MPDFDNEDFLDPELSWLSFCFDGNIGVKSSRAVNHFWKKVDGGDKNKYWVDDKKTYLSNFPNAAICDRFFQIYPYVGSD